MRVALDTNIVVSATLIRGGNEGRILRALQRGAFQLVLSPEILNEMGRVLFYERLQKVQWMGAEEIVALLQRLARESILVPGIVRVKACRDPEDDKFLAAAVEGHAPYVVSGDRDLLDMKTYRGIQIIRSAVFLEILRKAERTKP